MKEQDKKYELTKRLEIYINKKEEIKNTIASIKDSFNNDWLDHKRENDLSFYNAELAKVNNEINKINDAIISINNIIKEREKIDFIFQKEKIHNINIDYDDLENINNHIILSDISDRSVIYDRENNYLIIKDDNMLVNIDRDDLYNINNTDEFNKKIDNVNFNNLRKKHNIFRLQIDRRYMNLNHDFIYKNGHVYIRIPAVLILNTVKRTSDFTNILNLFMSKNNKK